MLLATAVTRRVAVPLQLSDSTLVFVCPAPNCYNYNQRRRDLFRMHINPRHGDEYDDVEIQQVPKSQAETDLVVTSLPASTTVPDTTLTRSPTPNSTTFMCAHCGQATHKSQYGKVNDERVCWACRDYFKKHNKRRPAELVQRALAKKALQKRRAADVDGSDWQTATPQPQPKKAKLGGQTGRRSSKL